MSEPTLPRCLRGTADRWAFLIVLGLLISGCGASVVGVQNQVEAAGTTTPAADLALTTPSVTGETLAEEDASPPPAASPSTPPSETPTPPPPPTETATPPTPLPESEPVPDWVIVQRGALNSSAHYTIDWPSFSHYNLDVDLVPPSIQGRLSLDYVNTTGLELTSLVFRLFPNGRPIYSGSMAIGAVSVNGAAATHDQALRNTVLRVHLPEPLPPGEHTNVEIDFATTVAGPSAGYGILNQANGMIIMGSWFPMLALHDGNDWQTTAMPVVGDAVSSDSALFTVRLRAPTGLTIASTGRVLLRDERGDRTQWTIVTGPARDFALAASTLWQPLEQVVDGVTVRYFAAPTTEGAPVPPEQGLAIVVEAVQAFNAHFSTYPYAKLDVVEADVPIGGYEYPGFVLFHARHRVTNNLDQVRFLLAHEVAHQWFYGLVGNNVTSEPWLDEGLATFATLLVNRDPAIGRPAWEREYAQDLAQRPVGVGQPVYSFTTWRTYRGPVYYASAIMMDDLRRELGDQAFFDAMRVYVRAFAFRRATADDLRRTFELTTGRDLSRFWSVWVGE